MKNTTVADATGKDAEVVVLPPCARARRPPFELSAQ